MKRRRPKNEPQPSPMATWVVHHGPVAFVVSFASASVLGLMTDLPVHEPFDWLYAHHLHWGIYACVIALIVWLWRPLQRAKVSWGKRLLLGPVLSFASIFVAAGLLILVNMLNVAPLTEVRGTVQRLKISCYRGEKRSIELLSTNGLLKLRVRRADWPRAQEGRPFVTHRRQGLLGISWRWTWE